MLSILFEWKVARVTVTLRTSKSEVVAIVANGVSDLRIPQMKEWGPSVSVNQIRGPFRLENGRHKLEIEMQSGDVILIDASDFKFPSYVNVDE